MTSASHKLYFMTKYGDMSHVENAMKDGYGLSMAVSAINNPLSTKEHAMTVLDKFYHGGNSYHRDQIIKAIANRQVDVSDWFDNMHKKK